MNGYTSLCGGEPCPPIFKSPVEGMEEDIMDNHVVCAIYRLPDVHERIARPPEGVKFLENVLNFLAATCLNSTNSQIVTIGDLKPDPVLWHEDTRRRFQDNGRKNPPGSISSWELGEAAHRLVVNSLQIKNRMDGNGYRRPNNGPRKNGPRTSSGAPIGHSPANGPRTSAALLGHRQPLPPYNNYESHPGYAVRPPPISAPPLIVPFSGVPSVQYGYNEPYSPPVVHNPHYQSNPFGRNEYQHPSSHHYERNNHHVGGGSARYGYPSSGNNQNPRFMNTQGAFTSHHDEVGRHSQNYQSYRASHQNWTPPPNNPSGHREYGQRPANQYSLLDRRAGRKPMPPPRSSQPWRFSLYLLHCSPFLTLMALVPAMDEP